MSIKNNNKIKEMAKSILKIRYILLLQAMIVGIFGGLIVVAYRFLLSKVTEYIFPIYDNVGNDILKIIGMFTILAFCGYIVGLIIKLEPMITGSGIPQVQGIMIGKMRLKWLRVIILKFIGGLISLGTGLSLGREGPSVQIGAASGMGVGKFFRSNKTEERLLITYGSSAGLAAAFNAPLAGVLFALEEIHKNFSPLILVGAMTAAISADFVSKLVFGVAPVFNFGEVRVLPIQQYPFIVVLGIVLGVLGVAFNKSIIFCVRKYAKIFKLPVEFRPILPFLSAGIIGIFMPMLLGGGHELIVALVENDYAFWLLVALFVVKFLFTIVSYSSSAPGGIFLPLLSIGAIIGCIVAKIFVFFDMDPAYVDMLIVLAMAGYFTSIVKSPITGIILISEMTGGFQNFLALSIVCIVSYVVSDVLKGEPVYEMLLKNTLKKGNEDINSDEKVLIEIPINLGTVASNKRIRDLNLPENILLVSIRRNGDEIIPKGNIRISNGDNLVILVEENKISEVVDYFSQEL